MAGGTPIAVGERDELGRVQTRCPREQVRAQGRVRAVQGERERGPHRCPRQTVEDALVADGGEDQFLVSDGTTGAEQFDGRKHVLQIMRGLAHAHEDDAHHRAKAAGEGDLGDDLGAAELASEPGVPGHAEAAADRAADLGGDAEPAARQQHGLDGLAVGQFDHEALRAVLRQVAGV